MRNRRPPRDETASRFDGRAELYDSQSLWVADQTTIDPLLTGIPPSATILDVGGGTGAVGLQAKLRGYRTVCTDISMGMLRQAKGKGLVTVQADMHALPFRDQSFDVIVIRQALQYAEVPRALREFSRLCVIQVRIGQIVARNERDRDLWKALFALLGQAERQVFLPGEIAETAASQKVGVATVATCEGSERLVCPNVISSVKQPGKAAIADTILQIDPEARAVGDDWVHLVLWEFTTLECSRIAE